MPPTIRDQYTNCATRLNIPNRTTTSNLPEHGQNPFQACPSARRNRLSKNRKRNNSAAMLYPALECFCTVVSSSSSSSCFSQQKHRKPARDTPHCGPETPGMAGKLTLAKAGRVVLPKPLRDELRLEPGDALEIENTGEEIILRPLRGQAQLRKKQGVWVFRTGAPLSASETEKAIRRVRQERESEALDQDP